MIPISRPLFGDEELAAVQEPLRDGWVVQGPRVHEFEERFAAFCGVPHAVATTSCTTALHLAVLGLGCGPGDEIIVPAFTWISTANVVEYTGATPVFADISLDTFNLAPDALPWSDRTRGVIAVHLFGRAAPALPAVPDGIWVLEDAACALGTRRDGVHAGALEDAGCFSFHPRKSITTGEGGMLVTRSAALAQRARVLRDHGASRSDLARHTTRGGFLLADYDELGFNYRMTDLQGALGCVQMDRAQAILDERARLAARYSEALAGLEALRVPAVGKGETHGWQAYVTLYERDDRNALMQALEDEGIATRPGTHAPVMAGYYRERYDLRPESFPNAVEAERRSLALPLYAGLRDDEQDRVIDALRRRLA